MGAIASLVITRRPLGAHEQALLRDSVAVELATLDFDSDGAITVGREEAEELIPAGRIGTTTLSAGRVSE